MALVPTFYVGMLLCRSAACVDMAEPRNDWTIIGSFALCYTFQPAIAWLANGVVDVNQLMSETVGFGGFATAFQDFATGQTLKEHVRTSAEW